MSSEYLRGRIGELRRLLSGGGARLHFAGISGASMSGLAEYFLIEGHSITGSDSAPLEAGKRLSRLGIPISPTNSAEHIRGADALIISSAIPKDSPECVYALANDIPTYTRAEALGALMLDYPVRIGISGSHGKSTTTAMLAHIFRQLGYGYNALVGAPIYDGSGLLYRGREGIIYEACEYRDAFLSFFPTTAVITGVELDHTDYFKDISALTDSFRRSVSEAEHLIINIDYPTSREILSGFGGEIITYGVDKGAIYRYNIISSGADGTRAAIYSRDEYIGEICLSLLGEYNVANATAAVATAALHGIEPRLAMDALSGFSGVPRRLEYLGRLGERAVYYDYAHHPTEIRLSLAALRLGFGGAIVAFRPHTYSRTRDLWRELIEALGVADEVILTDIYPAREPPIDGVNSQSLAKAVGERARYVPLSLLGECLCSLPSGKAPLVIMGAGDMQGALAKVKNKIKEG